MDYRKDIDGLRGIAILTVILFHAFPDYIPGGFVGVDIFFVISGYLITKIIKSNLEQGNFSYLDFYARRIRRLFPSLIVMITACFVAGWFLFDFGDFKLLGKHIAASSAFISNFIFLAESGYFDQTAITKPLLHIWSLSIEEQFYFIWPALIILVVRLQVKTRDLILSILVISFTLNIFLSYRDTGQAYYFPLSRFWELALGALLNYLPPHRNSKFTNAQISNVTGFLGGLGIILSCIVINKSVAFPGWWALLPTFSTFLLIYANERATLTKRLLTMRALVWLGLISYPMYLLHWPLLSFWKIVTLETPTALTASGILLLAGLMSTIVYLFFEKPIRKKGGQVTTLSLILSMAILGFLGHNMFNRDGYPFRPAAEAAVQKNIDLYVQESLPQRIYCSVEENNPGQCVSDTNDTSKPLVFFWGDSVTQNAQAGLTRDKVESLGIQLMVSNVGACPPIIGYIPRISNIDSCERFKSEGFSVISRHQPQTVVLFANWHGYLYEPKSFARLDLSLLQETIKEINKYGVEQVIIVGQFPTYDASQADIGRRVFSENEILHTRWLLKEDIFTTDEIIRNFSKNNNVTFISPLDLLCNEQGCQISADELKYIPMGFDSLHMTPRGAQVFLNKAFSRKLFTRP
jgi:peptidoglycan/LPS O-acetylase OafA/YrhL